jgi:5-dehydro-4-deoxyglucarate dehydratase
MPDSYSELSAAVGSGLLTFPVTHFRADYSFDEDNYRAHIDWLLRFKPAVLFAAGGTGEFFSLGLDEFERVVRAAVSETDGRVPVIAGCGYGTSLAREFASAAERAGASAILLLPHYLVAAEQAGIEAHVSAVCKSTRLGVIVYNRDNSIVAADTLARLCEANANLVGFKDGVGDIERLVKIRERLGDRLFYVGGLPTHETFAAPYHAAGVPNYSSAIFNFLPRFATDFYRAVQDGNAAVVRRGLRDFVLPYIEIRGRRKGYAVAIVKAGLASIGRPAGPVRPPLVDLTEKDLRDLEALLQSTGLARDLEPAEGRAASAKTASLA